MNGQIEPSEEILFFFSQINALDTVPFRQIKGVEIVDNKVKFDIVNDEGVKRAETRVLTPFVKNQLVGFELIQG